MAKKKAALKPPKSRKSSEPGLDFTLRSESILNSMVAHVAVLDPSGTILATNDAWNYFASKNQANLTAVGPSASYFDACRQAASQGDLLAQEALEGIKGVLDGRRDSFRLEYPCHSPGEQRWFVMSVTPLKGALNGAVVSHLNITDRKLAENKLKRSESTIRALMESTTQSIIAVDSNEKIVLANGATGQMFGYNREELIGQPLEVLVPEPARTRHSGYHKNYFANPQIRARGISLELEGRRKDGSHFPVEISLSTIDTEDGKLAVAFVTNITARKLAGEALRQSELQYRDLFDHMNEGLAYCKIILAKGEPADFLFLAVNSQFEKLTGLQDVVGKRATQIITGNGAKDRELLEIYAGVALTGVPKRFEKFINSIGQWYSISAYCPEHGFFVAVFDAIDERKRAEEALRRSEERLRLAVDSTGIGTFDFDPRTGKRIWSDVSKSYFGLPPEAEGDDTLRDAILPADAGRVDAAFEHALQPESGGHYAVEFRTRGIQDGKERWISAWGRAFFDSNGQPERMIGVIQDLTERKKIEEALRQREQEISTLLDATPDIIMRIDRQFRYTYVNARTAHVSGLPREAFIGKTALELGLPQDLVDHWRPATRSAFETGQSSTIEFTYPSEAGATEWEELFVPEFAPDGKVETVLIVGRDVTERKRLERIANVYRDEIRALAANLLTAQEEERRRVSRELHDQTCQELASLAIDIGTLAANPPPRKDVQSRLKTLQSRVVRASDLTRHIAYQLHSSVLDDLGLAASLQALCKEFSNREQIAITFHNAASPALIPRQIASCLFQVAEESLRNIVKHAHAKEVTMTLYLEAGAVVLTVADDGDGFDPAVVSGRGGLGLVGMKERTRLVNGKLTILAQLGQGTRVTLQVPLPALSSDIVS